MPATEVYSAAQEALVSIGTLKRAKKMLKVRSRRESLTICLRRTRQQKRDGFGSCPTMRNSCARTKKSSCASKRINLGRGSQPRPKTPCHKNQTRKTTIRYGRKSEWLCYWQLVMCSRF